MWTMDTRIAWRNIWRNPRRTVLTLLAIAFAAGLLVFMVSLQFGSYEAMISSAVGLHTGDLQVRADGYGEDYAMHLVVADPEAVRTALARQPEISAMTPRARGFALLASPQRTYAGMVLGVDPAGEQQASTLARIVRRGRFLQRDDVNTALIGDALARNLRVDIGDELTLLGQGRDGSIAATVLVVTGVFQSGQTELDRSTVYIPLAHFQDVFAMRGAVHEMVLRTRDLQTSAALSLRLDAVVAGLDSRPPLRVRAWFDLMPGLLESIQMDLASSAMFHLILIAVVTFSILNTFVMVVFERTREFGVLLALGTPSGRLIRILMGESALLTLGGVLLGLAAGCAATWYTQRVGIPMGDAGRLMAEYGLPERIYPRLSWLSALLGPAVVFVLTLLAALFPALRVRRLRPVPAMRAA